MMGPVLLALRALMALALYGFLGWAFFLLLKEIKQQGSTLAGRRAPGITITIEQDLGISAVRHFGASSLIVGRDPGSDLPLSDDTVSTRHAQFVYHHNQWWIVDLSSKNGTFLNGIPIEMPTVITSGDEIKCGNARLHINFSDDIFISNTQRLEKK